MALITLDEKELETLLLALSNAKQDLKKHFGNSSTPTLDGIAKKASAALTEIQKDNDFENRRAIAIQEEEYQMSRSFHYK